MRHPIDARFNEIDGYIKRCNAADVPEEMRGYLFRYGSVLICGAVERSVEIIVLERLTSKAHPRVLNFVKAHFKRGHNLDCAAIEELLGRFDISWKSSFCDFVQQNADVKEAISSCYAVRNSVAHGGTASIGSARLSELYSASKRLIDGLITSTATRHRDIGE